MPLRLFDLIFGMKPVFFGSFFLLAGFFFVAAMINSFWMDGQNPSPGMMWSDPLPAGAM